MSISIRLPVNWAAPSRNTPVAAMCRELGKMSRSIDAPISPSSGCAGETDTEPYSPSDCSEFAWAVNVKDALPSPSVLALRLPVEGTGRELDATDGRAVEEAGRCGHLHLVARHEHMPIDLELDLVGRLADDVDEHRLVGDVLPVGPKLDPVAAEWHVLERDGGRERTSRVG